MKTPSSPDDSLPPLGEKKEKPPSPEYTYESPQTGRPLKPIPNRPGWYTTPDGKLEYYPTLNPWTQTWQHQTP